MHQGKSNFQTRQSKHRIAIVDARCGGEIFKRLNAFVDFAFPFETNDITYKSISCHPDIFMYSDESKTIVAPNAPRTLIETMRRFQISFEFGSSEIGHDLTDTCFYNCISTPHFFFHKKGFTDGNILKSQTEKKFVELPQPYTRCSMMALGEKNIITSDQGICKSLSRQGFNVCYFSPEQIRIPTHKYGFIGGTCGVRNRQIFFLGNPLLHKDGRNLCQFIENSGYEIISLGNDYLYDGGGVFFL